MSFSFQTSSSKSNNQKSSTRNTKKLSHKTLQTSDYIQNLQQTLGNQAVQKMIKSGVIQPKLKISQPKDPYEKEADRVAEQIMRKADSYYKQTSIQDNLENNAHRKCSSCQTNDEKELEIRKKSVSNNSNLEASDEISNQINNIGGGRSLDSTTKDFMESRFGRDFSSVRIHDDSKSNELARSINARAFTTGNDIFLGPNESISNKRLMAHEITHVVQQKALHKTVHRDLIQRDQYDDFGKKRRRSPFEEARDACNNRMNWSDGGWWIGSGSEPDCSMRQTVRRGTTTITYRYPTEESAIRARDQLNRSRNRLGYIAGGLITLITFGGASPWAAVLAGFGGSALTDHIPSFVDLVRSGDVLTIRLEVEATRSAHPWGPNGIVTGATWILRDRSGNIKWGASSSNSFNPSGNTSALFDRFFNALGN